MIHSMLLSRHSSLERLGSNLPVEIDFASRVKKCKRWLDSKYTDCQTFFTPFILKILKGIGSNRRLVFVIDGSEVGNGNTCLMISLNWRKRSIPVCWIVRRCKKGHLPVNAHLAVVQLLSKLIEEMPNEVFLLGDGEFDSTELQKYCIDQKWHYVFRSAKNTIIHTQNGDQFELGSLYPEIGANYFLLQDAYMTKKRYGLINALVWHNRKHKKPIYLISNIEWAKDIMDLYKKRFSIETIFSDIKSRGFNINKVRIKDTNRINSLLIIVALTYLMVFALGTYKDHFESLLPLVVNRVDRLNQYSPFFIGLAITKLALEKTCKLNKIRKNLFKYICVRF